MNTKQQKQKKSEVYSISGFRDTLASPVFYPVIVVALVLGIASIFGFVQNPLKLKSMVTVIQQKVSTSNLVSNSYQTNQALNFADTQEIQQSTNTAISKNSNHTLADYSFELFSGTDANPTEKMPLADAHERIAFNYDVTSESFWTDLDSSKLETASEEMERKQKESANFGAPLNIDHQENLPSKFKVEDHSIYAINSNKF